MKHPLEKKKANGDQKLPELIKAISAKADEDAALIQKHKQEQQQCQKDLERHIEKARQHGVRL